jgi:hypothetical protein
MIPQRREVGWKFYNLPPPPARPAAALKANPTNVAKALPFLRHSKGSLTFHALLHTIDYLGAFNEKKKTDGVAS